MSKKAKTPPKEISFNPHQSSSAASHYGDADQGWLSKLKGTVNWVKIPQVDPGKIMNDLKGMFDNGAGKFAKEVASAIFGNLRELIGKAKNAFKIQIGSILKVGDKMWGQVTNTAEGKGLAIFGALAAAFIGGGVATGAGPEMITGMLRMTQFFYAINLKESDKQIEDQIQGSITSLYAVAGETFGSGLASFVSGGVFRIPRIQINVTKVTIFWRSLNEEAKMGLLAQLRSLARTAFFTGVRIMAKVFYRSSRKFIKELARKDPNHPLIKQIPGGAKSVEQWGAGGPPWSLSLYVQGKIEKLQSNPQYKNIGVFLENAMEGFGEGIQEFLPELVRQPVT